MAGWIGSPGFITAVALERKQRHMDPHLSISGADPVSLFWCFSRGKGCNSPRLVGGQISPLEHLFCKEKIRFTLFLVFVWNMHKPGHAASAFHASFSYIKQQQQGQGQGQGVELFYIHPESKVKCLQSCVSGSAYHGSCAAWLTFRFCSDLYCQKSKLA